MQRGKEVWPTKPPYIALLTLASNCLGLSLKTAAASWLRGSSWLGSCGERNKKTLKSPPPRKKLSKGDDPCLPWRDGKDRRWQCWCWEQASSLHARCSDKRFLLNRYSDGTPTYVFLYKQITRIINKHVKRVERELHLGLALNLWSFMWIHWRDLERENKFTTSVCDQINKTIQQQREEKRKGRFLIKLLTSNSHRRV